MRAFHILLALLLASPAAAQTTYTPPFTASVVGSGQPGIQSPLFFWNGFGGQTFDPRSTLRVDRDVETDPTAAGGTLWYTYKAFWAITTTGYASPGFEWAITGELHNRTRKSANAQNVAVNGTAWKQPTDDGEETGTTWALNGNAVDQTGATDPTTSLIAMELDIGGVVGTDKNRQRVGLHIAGGGQSGSHVGLGMMISPGDQVTIDRGILFHPGGGTYGVGIDFREASFQIAPIMLGDSQSIGLDSAYRHGIAYAGGEFMFWGTGGKVFGVNDRGRFLSGYSVEFAPAVPTHSTDACEVGQHAWDQNYDYRCVSSGRWRRVAFEDF